MEVDIDNLVFVGRIVVHAILAVTIVTFLLGLWYDTVQTFVYVVTFAFIVGVLVFFYPDFPSHFRADVLWV